MSRCFICTVGTSVITNPDNRNFKWKRGNPLPLKEDIVKWLNGADPIIASAELHTLFRLKPEEGERAVFLHSDTDEGKLCAESLAESTKYKWQLSTEIDIIKSLEYRGGTQAAAGLKNLSRLLIKHKDSAIKRGETPVFCATGGFKSEISFSNLMGILTGCEVYYIHEQFRELVRMPVLPIGEDRQFIKDNINFFEWIDTDFRTAKEARSWLESNPKLDDLVEYNPDGNVYLNPAADLLYRLFRGGEEIKVISWPEESVRSPQEKNNFSAIQHHRPDGWDMILDKLCKHYYVDEVRYTEFKPGKQIRVEPNGIIKINYSKNNKFIGYEISTTAKNDIQTERIAKHIKRRILE
jgi:putative CRISPR-associated protein (TIGR02619 family)